MNDSELKLDRREVIKVDEASSAALQQLLRFLLKIPLFNDGLKTFLPSDVFRVTMSARNVHLFKQAADGTYKPSLRNAGKFVENVNLERLPPNYLALASNALYNINMAAMAANLDIIKIELRDSSRLASDTNRGEVLGAISAVRQAKALSDADERRRESLGACRDLSVKLGKLTGQLKAHIWAMPEPETGFFDGFFGSRMGDADAKYPEVEADLFVLRDGVSMLLQTYSELGEPDAARVALSAIIDAMEKADLSSAARKARLVKVSDGGVAPETTIKLIIQSITEIEQRLLTQDSPLLLPIELHIKVEEFLSCPMSHDPAPAAVT